MLASNTLQPPQSGRSRFSKALPAVPGLATENVLPPLPLATPRKELPASPRPDITSREQQVPFSPLSAIASPTSSASTPTSIKSKMTIPRRPVGGGAGQKGPGLPAKPGPDRAPAPVQVTTQTHPQPQILSPPAAKTTTSPAAYVPPPSPSESLSSILSAYSRSSTGSPVISSEGAASFRDSHRASSPTQFDASPDTTTLLTASTTPITPVTYNPVPPPKASPFTNKANQQQQQPTYTRSQPALSPIPVDTSAPPPPPAKDTTSTQQPQTTSRNQTATSDLSAPSPPRPQIWRRRSINKSKDLPALNIQSSHGSTASSASTQAQSKVDEETASILTQSTTETIKPLPPLSATKPLPPIVGLPGRNVRPVPSKQGDSEMTTEMGNEPSKLKRLSAKLHLSRGTTETSSSANATGRPPTPEYQKQDVKTPMLETFVSPVSPASSPEPGREAPLPVSKDPSPRFPQTATQPLPKLETGSITRKAVAPAPVPELHPTRSVPDLRSATPSTPSAPLPSLPSVTPSFAVNRERRPSDAASLRGRESTDTSKFPPRGSSVKPEGRQKIVSSQSLPQTGSSDHDPRLVRSNSGNMMYRGRDGTLYPEMKDPGTPDPKAAHFPIHPQGRIADGTILPAPPIRDSHYLCYQKHRNMGRRVNRQYPLTCQTCDKADVEDRWVCTFCQLRTCTPCFEKLKSNDRDLKRLMQSVKSPEIPSVLTLSSSERPGSALGLQINF
ncbi:hypothetical protein CC79DRAFT_74246 [Sarocladium strictum]